MAAYAVIGAVLKELKTAESLIVKVVLMANSSPDDDDTIH